jgi:hypothetical protein
MCPAGWPRACSPDMTNSSVKQMSRGQTRNASLSSTHAHGLPPAKTSHHVACRQSQSVSQSVYIIVQTCVTFCNFQSGHSVDDRARGTTQHLQPPVTPSVIRIPVEPLRANQQGSSSARTDRRSATTMSAPQKRVWAVTATLTLMCFFASLVQQCCAAVPSEPAPPGPPPYPFNDPTLPTDQRVADLVSRLTLEEKVTHTHSHTSFIDAAWRVCMVAMQMVLHQRGLLLTQVRACSGCSAWCKCLPPLTKDNETRAVHMARVVASPGPSFALVPRVGSCEIIERVCIAVWFACMHTHVW